MQNDPDKHFILEGLKHGFPIVDTQDITAIPTVRSDNHTSALKNCEKVEKRLLEEIEDGKYISVQENCVKIISPLAAIEKSDGDVRLIHDLSHPQGHSLNDYATKDPCKYESLDEAIQLLQPGMWMAKCDLKWAYRSMAIKPEHYTLTGLQWTFSNNSRPTTLVDKRLPFGARKSPATFNSITKSIKRMMVRRGYNCIVFLDDFFLCEISKEKCASALATLISLLRKLGFRINWKKVEDPCQDLVFLGVRIDLKQGILQLDPKKTKQLVETLQTTVTKQRLSKRQLQKLAGQLNWASTVIQWGRAFLSSFFQAIRTLKHANHKIKLHTALRSDLQWWVSSLQHTTHWRPIWPVQRPAFSIATDASLTGGGAFSHSDGAWVHVNWAIDRPSLVSASINVKELAMIEQAVHVWGPLHRGHHFAVETDNIAAAFMVNNKSARSGLAASLVRSIASTALRYGLSVTAMHVPGVTNDIPDSISRLHSPGQFLRLSALLSTHYGPTGHPTYCLIDHMSPLTLLYLLPQVHKALNSLGSWIKRLHSCVDIPLRTLHNSHTSLI